MIFYAKADGYMLSSHEDNYVRYKKNILFGVMQEFSLSREWEDPGAFFI